MTNSKQLNIPQLKISKISWSTLSLALLIGCIFGLNYLTLFNFIENSLLESTFNNYAFLTNIFIFTSLGALIWSRPIDGESSLVYPFLSLSLILAAILLFFIAPLIEITVYLNKILFPWADATSIYKIFFSRLITFIPTIGFFSFLIGGTIPFLTEMSLTDQRGLRQNLPALLSLFFIGLTIGFFLNIKFQPIISLNWLNKGTAILAIITAITTTLLYNIQLKSSEDSFTTNNKINFWPTKSLGRWSGETRYGNEQSINRKLAKPIWIIIFLSSILLMLILTTVFYNYKESINLSIYIFLIPITLAIGILTFTNLFNWQHNLIIALLFTILFFMLTLFLGTNLLNIIKETANNKQINLFIILILLSFAALTPISGQILQAKRGWVSSSIGICIFYLTLGLGLGLIISIYFQFYENRYFPTTILILSLIILFFSTLPILTKIPSIIFIFILAFLIYQYFPTITFNSTNNTTENKTINKLLVNYFTENNINLNLYKIISTNNYFEDLNIKKENVTVASVKNNNLSGNTYNIKEDILFLLNLKKQSYDLIILNDNYLNKNNINLKNTNLNNILHKNSAQDTLIIFILNENNKDINTELFNNFKTIFSSPVLIKFNNFTLLLNKSINFKNEFIL